MTSLEGGDVATDRQTIVFFHAHPDDEAIFSGGTMARLAAIGHRVVVVMATSGGQAGFPPESQTPPVRWSALQVTPREYIEGIAAELSRLRGRGLLLSPADAGLALSWHAAGIPLSDVQAELRRARRLKPPAARGTAAVGLTLQLFAPALAAQARRKIRARPPAPGLAAELLLAARSPRLAARAAWEAIARRAEDLLASGGDAYWAASFGALRSAMRELPRESVRQLGRDLRARMAPRPAAMPRARYRKSLQLQLLAAASERLGVPPRAFLL